MLYTNNPFYILNASPEDPRRRILALAEEKALKNDSSAYTEAQSMLVTPSKRLSAELRWFLDVTPSQMEEIFEYIDDYRTAIEEDPIPLGNFSALTKLNICVACIQVKAEFELTMLKTKILEISALFNSIKSNDVLALINEKRNLAGFAPIDKISVIDTELHEYRLEIGRLISQIIQKVTKSAENLTAYAVFATSIANLYSTSKRHAGSVILEDILNDYELYANEKLNACLRDMRCISETITNQRGINLPKQVESFISSLEDWDAMAQPLQLLSTSQGDSHENTLKAYSIAHTLMVELLDKCDDLSIVFDFLKKMQSIFKESPELLEELQSEEQLLIQVKSKADQLEEKKKKSSKKDGALYTVRLNKTRFSVPKYCMYCLESTNDEIPYNGGFSLPVCKKCQQEKEKIKRERATRQLNYLTSAQQTAQKILNNAFFLALLCSLCLTAALIYFVGNLLTAYVVGAVVALIIYALKAKKEIEYIELGYHVLDNTDTNGFAKVEFVDSSTIDFIFTNQGYAELFAEANDSSVNRSLPKSSTSPDNIRRTIAAKSFPKVKNYQGWIIGLMFAIAIICTNYLPVAKYVDAFHSSTPKTASTSTTPAATKAPAVTTKRPTATNTPAPVSVYNGKLFIKSDYEGTCPFEVKADSTSNYYIYLEYQRAPSNSTTTRDRKTSAYSPYESDVAFYLEKGKSYEIDVPVGVYKLYYATGDTFYGTKLLFGDKTRFYASDDLLNFYSDSQYYNGHTITLYSVSHGNFDTDPISESSFPGR